MNTKKMILSSLLVVFVVVGVALVADQATGSAIQTLTAAKTAKAPANLDDAAWQKAKALDVPFDGKEKFAGKKAFVTTRALYTDSEVFFLFKWKDATQSVTKSAWQFDGEKWGKLKGDEDRIALQFEINRINNFATKGCAVLCHGPAGAPMKQFKYATASAAEKGDLWHWKAARTDPYHSADDGWLTAAGEVTGRKDDAGGGGDARNETADKSKPRFMQDPVKKPSFPGFLLAEEAVEITDHSKFKKGDTLTYRMPKKPSGSRGDIKALSRYADGGWTVMLTIPGTPIPTTPRP
ncbi:MAG: ethylbenzene dehydrogenase-related protein [Desulfobacterales bacterium]|nr:ethylbenzene dehydrogenase-related protein [Desulfobacterales bacterium]